MNPATNKYLAGSKPAINSCQLHQLIHIIGVEHSGLVFHRFKGIIRRAPDKAIALFQDSQFIYQLAKLKAQPPVSLPAIGNFIKY